LSSAPGLRWRRPSPVQPSRRAASGDVTRRRRSH